MHHYFVYKNGHGNCWSDFSHGPLDDQGRRHLYVGFDNIWAGLEPTLYALEKASAIKGPRSDISNIRLVSHESNRASFILLTFEQRQLCFWRVLGQVEFHEVGTSIWASALEAARDDADLKPDKGMLAYSYFPGTVPDGEERGFRSLPVELIAAVPRPALYTSIDSLSVYQYLNRGTCRPLWRISGPTGADLREPIRSAAMQGSRFLGDRVCRDTGTLSQETVFAAFVRLYLNDCLQKGKLPTVRLSDLPGLTTHSETLDYQELVLNSLNPILVETAALALCRDLGLTPDVGVGKGIDVVDVRARAAGANGEMDHRRAKKAHEQLVGGGVEVTSSFSEKLLARGVLDIQCKAADARGVPDDVLYFGFARSHRAKQPQLLVKDLPAFLESKSFRKERTALREFLAVQQSVLRGAWQS